jgi:hypothetical protein
MFQRDLLNRGSHFHLFLHRLRFLEPAIETSPADRCQLKTLKREEIYVKAPVQMLVTFLAFAAVVRIPRSSRERGYRSRRE